jgi:hypothetical protein
LARARLEPTTTENIKEAGAQLVASLLAELYKQIVYGYEKKLMAPATI